MNRFFALLLDLNINLHVPFLFPFSSVFFPFCAKLNKKIMSLETIRETGYVTVAKGREDPAVKIYYELHGDGPEHVVLIMGTCKVIQKKKNTTCYQLKYCRLEFFLFGLGKTNEISCRDKKIYNINF
jgi:hypothetical protein